MQKRFKSLQHIVNSHRNSPELLGIFSSFLMTRDISVKANFGALGRSSLFALINLGTMGNGQRLQATIAFHRGIVHRASEVKPPACTLHNIGLQKSHGFLSR